MKATGLVLLASLSMLPALAQGAGTAKPAKTPRIIPTPNPKEPAVTSGERTFTDGSATWKLGKREMKMSEVKGSIQSSSGFQIASVAFVNDKKERLQIDFMYLGTGPVEPQYITSIYAVDADGATTGYKKNVSTCQVVLEEATPTMVAGTASCPKGMLDQNAKPGKPITEVKFRAESKN